jgi:hypothetical protein
MSPRLKARKRSAIGVSRERKIGAKRRAAPIQRQSSLGFSTWSMTSTSIWLFDDSSLRPNRS